MIAMKVRIVFDGKYGVLVRVAEAGEQPAAVGGEVEPVQPVVGGLEQDEEAREHRDLHLCSAREPVLLRLQPDPAEQVVHDGRRQQAEHRQREPEVDEVVQPRQVEDVEPDVLLEVGVLGAERRAVPPEQELPPLPGAGAAGEQRQHDRDAISSQRAQRVDDLAVAVEVDLLLGRGPEQRPEPVGHDDVGRDDHAHQQPEHQEQQHLGAEHLGEHLGVADAAEPQPVGADAGEHRDQEEGHDQHDDRPDQRTGPLLRARSGARAGAARGCRRRRFRSLALRPVLSVLEGAAHQL